METGEWKRVRFKKPSKAHENLPEIVVNLSASALIWLFGVLVFLPMAKEIDPKGLSILISLIILLAFSFFLFKCSRDAGKVLEATSDILTDEWIQRRNVEEQNLKKRTKKRIKVALKASTIVLIYLFYSPLLATIHPSINGIGIIITILGILWIVLKKDNE